MREFKKMKAKNLTIKSNKKNSEDKEVKELQKKLDRIKTKIKKSSNFEDKLFYRFLESHYLDLNTGLITSKENQESHSISCGEEEFKHSANSTDRKSRVHEKVN